MADAWRADLAGEPKFVAREVVEWGKVVQKAGAAGIE